MRTHGTLTKWNDDRGFGFITPARGEKDVFVHISAFPREGGRPRLNELISFEVEVTSDGKQRAVRIMRPGQKAAAGSALPRKRAQNRGSKFGGALAAAAILAIGVYGVIEFRQRTTAHRDTPASSPLPLTSSPSPYSCDGRTMCSQMTSCAEATYFIRNCPNTQMDGDSDGVPCETQWCQ